MSMSELTVKRYGFGVFGGFKQDQFEGTLVQFEDYEALWKVNQSAEMYRDKYLKERNELLTRLKATDRKLTAVIAERDELRTQCDAKDQVIETYESAKFGLQQSQADGGVSMANAIADIVAERWRQQSKEGWTLEHDDRHVEGTLAQGAACYCLSAAKQSFALWTIWPWDANWWKPKNPRRDLVRAAALIVAEIERLDRASAHSGGSEHG